MELDYGCWVDGVWNFCSNVMTRKCEVLQDEENTRKGGILIFVSCHSTCRLLDASSIDWNGSRRALRKSTSEVSNRMKEYVPPCKISTDTSLDSPKFNQRIEWGVIASRQLHIHQTWFTHRGVNKAWGISIKMKVKGKLLQNINLGQECIYWRNPSFVIKKESVRNV